MRQVGVELDTGLARLHQLYRTPLFHWTSKLCFVKPLEMKSAVNCKPYHDLLY